jgi:hypothetical protein
VFLSIYIYAISPKKEMVILKLDFEKTFNKIEHEMIIRIMRQKGFSSMWVDWVHRILKSGTSTILLNGTPRKVFQCRRGIR